MKTLVYDLETSGLPDWKAPADAPGQPRICEIAAVLLDDAMAEIDFSHDLIKPVDWDHEIHPDAAAAHGLTKEGLEAEGAPIAEALRRFLVLFDQADRIVGYGISFDEKLRRGEARRLGLPDRYGEKPTIDLLHKCTPLCKLPPTDKMMATGRKTFKTPKLGEAVDILLGRKLDGAHDAIVDVRATADLFRYLKKQGVV